MAFLSFVFPMGTGVVVATTAGLVIVSSLRALG